MIILGVAGKAGSGKSTVADALAARFGLASVALADPMKRFAAQVFRFSEAQLWGPSEERNQVDLRYEEDLDGISAAAIPSPEWLMAWWRLEQYGAAWLTEIGAPHDAIHALRAWFIALMLESVGIGPYLRPLSSGRAPTTPRRVLQTLGTEFGRTVRADLWVDHMLEIASRLVLTVGASYVQSEGVVVVPGSGGVQPRGVVVSDVRFDNESARIRQSGGYVLGVHRPGAGLRGATGNHPSERGFDALPLDGILENGGTLEDLLAKVARLELPQ